MLPGGRDYQGCVWFHCCSLQDAKRETQGDYYYRNQFIGADPVWNVTGSGGTNHACLAANKGSEWKCLLAQ
jgi:hypothetical protein